jgi:hypothetical protein
MYPIYLQEVKQRDKPVFSRQSESRFSVEAWDK